MSPQALSSFRILRSLGLPPETLRKITIASDGKPCFTALTDEQFDELKRAVNRVYPRAMDLVRPHGHHANVVAGDY